MNNLKFPKLDKRVFSFLVDLFLFFFLTFGTYFLVTTSILTNNFGGKELNQKFAIIQIDSKLYDRNEDTLLFIEPSAKKKPEYLYNHYVLSGLAPKEYDLDLYYDEILLRNDPKTLFDWSVEINEATPWLVSYSASKEAAVETFYQDAWELAHANFKKTTAYLELFNPLMRLESLGRIITAVIFIAIIYLIIPSFTPNGATIGQLLMQIGHVTMYGYRMSKGQKAYRAVTSVLVNWVGLLLGVPIISTVIMTIRKDGRNLTDLGAGTLTVDTKNSMIFNNIEEEENFKASLVEQKSAIDEWHKETNSYSGDDK